MHLILIIIHITAAVFLTLIILLQQSSGGGLSGMFGGGSGVDDMLSSPSGNVFLRKITVTLVVIFFSTSLILAVKTAHKSTKSLLERRPMQQPVSSSPRIPVPEPDTSSE